MTMKILADACVGTVIGGRYAVDKVIGCGGMGFVLAATHQLTGGRVALKLMPSTEGASLDRLLLEAKAPALVKHPNLVEVHDVGYDEPTKSYFLVQELLDGVDLRTYLEAKGRLPWREAVTLLTPIMDALSAAHEAGIVHRDLKPENLFLAKERDGSIVPRVLDFGIARATNQKSRLTTVGGTLGTPSYMSPSSARGELDVGPEADVWSMGVILFECVSGGAMPFDGPNYNAIMNAIVSTRAPRIDSIRIDVPKPIADVIAYALEHDRACRYATMSEMMHALLDAADSVPMEHAVILPPAIPNAAQRMSTPPAPSPSAVTQSFRVPSDSWKPAATMIGTFCVAIGLLFGVRALATPRAPLVMVALSARPAMVHYPAPPRTPAVQTPAMPAQTLHVARRAPAVRRNNTHVATHISRNGALLFEP